jgi:hypothetical protein
MRDDYEKRRTKKDYRNPDLHHWLYVALWQRIERHDFARATGVFVTPGGMTSETVICGHTGKRNYRRDKDKYGQVVHGGHRIRFVSARPR